LRRDAYLTRSRITVVAAGYSGKPLAAKLGIKPGTNVVAIGAPANYKRLLGRLPPGSSLSAKAPGHAQFVHIFVKTRADLAGQLATFRGTIAPNGTLWVSWPKKASGVRSDVTEDVIRELALPVGFVDVKVCAVDETWSGLKLVIRVANRR
jgi:hypothetical protein